MDCMHDGAGNLKDFVVSTKMFGGGFVDDYC